MTSTFGKTIRLMSVGPFHFREVAYAPGSSIPTHHHLHPVIVLVIQGRVNALTGEADSVHCPHSFRIVPANVPHSNTYSGAAPRCFLIELRGTISSSEAMTAMRTPAAFSARSSPATAAWRAYREFSSNDPFAPLAVHGASLELMAAISRSLAEQRADCPRWLSQLYSSLRDDFGHISSITALCKTLRVHPVHAARAFRRHYEATPAQFLRRRRFEAALELLLTTNLPISTVAQTCGFADHSHLVRECRSHCGITPSQYRLIANQDMPALSISKSHVL